LLIRLLFFAVIVFKCFAFWFIQRLSFGWSRSYFGRCSPRLSEWSCWCCDFGGWLDAM
jgi:uncharacterized membrane protein